MPDNSLNQFTAYIELLCTQHVDILHTQDDPHFIELNDEKQLAAGKNQVYPLVALDKLTINYSGANDGMLKSRVCDILFLEKAPAGDYVEVQRIKNKMELIAEEFVVKMKQDSRNRAKYPFLRNLVVGSIEINHVDNEGINLHGALLSFSYELPFPETISEGRFDENVSFPMS